LKSSKARVVIVGAGGHGSEIQAYMRELLRDGWDGQFLGFVDDAVPKGRHRNLEVLGTLAELASNSTNFLMDLTYLTAVGDNAARRRIVERVTSLCGGQVKPWTLLHPSAFVGEAVEIGEGTLLAPGTIVTSRARIGRHCILNVKASVSHDCEVGDYVSLNPGVTVCGMCRIGDGACIGAGATVINGMEIGALAVIGAGAVVTRNIPPGVTAVGVPARITKTD